jgi:transposase
MNSNSVPIFVGLDYHMNCVQVCVMNGGGQVLVNRGVRNDWRAIVEVVSRHGDRILSAIESCAGAADLAEQLVSLAGWSVHLAHPGYVGRMKQNPDKTDYSDARMLADLERVGYLPQVWLAPQFIRELRKLVRYRQQLVDERKSAKMRIKAILREQRLVAPNQAGGRWTKRWTAWLKQADGMGEQSRWIIDRHLCRLESLADEVDQVEQRLHTVTRDDLVVKNLRSQPGIGPVTSWVMRAMIGRFDRFRSGKQLARFCGLSPRNDSSGERQAQSGMIKAGDDLLKSTLIQAGHRLIRHHARWSALAMKMRTKGKLACVIVAAIVNRWMRGLFYQLKETSSPTMMNQAA